MTQDSDRNEEREISTENTNGIASPAMPPLVSIWNNKEHEANEENKGNGEDASNATSPNPDDTAPVVYSPMNSDYSPGREEDEAPLHPMHQHDTKMGVNMRAHGLFVKRLADAISEATADHIATYDYVEKSLGDLQELILRRLERNGNGARYLPSYFEVDLDGARKMKRRRRSPFPAAEERDTSQSSSCCPECPGE